MAHRSAALACFALGLALLPTAYAQRMPGLAKPLSVALSPDGAMLAWTLDRTEGTTLHLNPLPYDAGKDMLLSPTDATSCSNTDPVWSPDSQTLAFTSTCTGTSADAKQTHEHPGQAQIFLWSRSDGRIRQLTLLTGLFKQAAWSPDGRTLAFLFVENATRSAGATDAMKPWAGVIGQDNLEIQGVYGVHVASGNGAWLVPPTPQMYTFEFAWSPSGKELAFIGSPAPGENTWWIARLYTEAVEHETAGDGGDDTTHLNAYVVLDPNTVTGPLHGLQIAVPRWSPDGSKIAVIGGLMSDQGATGGDIWVVNAAGTSAPQNVTPDIDGTPAWIGGWFDNNSLGFVEDRRGHTLLVAWDIHKKAACPGECVTDLGETSVSGGPIKDAVTFSGKTDTAAFVRSGLTTPPEIWFETGGKLHQITHLNDGIHATTHTELVEWTNEGFHVQGWLTLPTGYDPAKHYPVLVQVHGGPSSSILPSFNMEENYAGAGYFVLQANPRGSFGQGEKFTEANREDFGYGDLRDILAGLDTVEAKYPAIDKTREGLTGWSYGGFMSMFAPTQTQRFKAVVAGAGISDWLSYYGENSINEWMVPFFGAAVYNDPAVYAKSSAMSFIQQAKTPMLIIVGDRDGECPAPQSFEMWNGLKFFHVPTELVIYPNEGHHFKDPAHVRDRDARTLAWFAKYLKP
jgi:dipeptidyl aminopeptidase/acylaminoacyl peptidase